MARPRTYLADKVTPIRVAPPREQGDRTIPTDAPLLSIKAASEALTAQYGDGFSTKTLRRYVDNGEWSRGWHYVRVGRKTKIYLEAVREWVLSQ